MAGHEWKDWFEREEFIGQISDIRVQNLQVEREVVQKRTFTRWMNLHLEKCNPPMEVQDLFRDIQDGRILMALLEELSGCKLLHGFKKSSHRIFRLNNIAKVLAFLEERNVKLVSIDAADVADGNSSIVLGLIWNIILFFQIKELTGNIKSQFPSSSSLSSIPTSSDSDTSHSSTPSEERRPSTAMRDHGKPIKTLLQWVQRRTRKYGVAVQDFGKSWTSGLAFLAVIKSIDPSLVDMRRSLLRTAKENLEDAFRTAHYSLGIPRLLEPEDVTINPPDEQSIMTYVSQFLEHFPGIEEPQDVSEVIERSVSMGRLSSRSSDYELTRNGVHRSRQRDRPYVVRKDWVQPPPKIFISTVSEDKEAISPTSPTSGSRPWASEGSSVGSSTSPSGDPQDEGREVFTISTSNSPQPSYVDSLIGSSAPESVICDSAIGSPDSWTESEAATPDRFGESRSDGSICDSVMGWEASIPPATPEEVTLDDRLVMSVKGKPQDEQSLPELFIDEGVYSLSSLDSTLERGKDSLEKQEIEGKEEEDAYRYILDLSENGSSENVLDQKEDSNKTLQDTGQSNVALSNRQPTLELIDITRRTETEETGQSLHISDQVNPDRQNETEELVSVEMSKDQNLEGSNKMVEINGDSQEAHVKKRFSDRLDESKMRGEVKVESVSATKGRTDSVSEREREEEQLKKVVEERLNEVTGSEAQEKTRHNFPNGHTEPQEDAGTESNRKLEQTDPHSLQPNIQNIPARLVEEGVDSEENHTGQTDSQTPVLDFVNPLSSVSSDSPGNLLGETRSLERDGKVGDEDPVKTRFSEGQLFNINDDTPDHSKPTEVSSNELNSMKQSDEAPESATCKLGIGLVADRNPPEENVKTENKHDDSPEPTDSIDSTLIQNTDNREILKTQSGSNGGQEGDKAITVEHTDNKMADTDKNGSKLVELANNNEIAKMESKVTSEAMDLFYADIDRSSPLEEPMRETLDPMDLFYPDKEEPMLTDQLEKEEGMFSSCFSVSALQPAPASEPLPETHNHGLQETHSHGLTEVQSSNQLGEMKLGGDSTRKENMMKQENDKVAEETQERPDEPFEPQEQCTLLGDTSSGVVGVLDKMETETHCVAKRSDLIKTDEEKLAAARENMKSMRGEVERDGAETENQLSSTRHRKVAESDELKKDNQKCVVTSKTYKTNLKNSSKELKTPAAAECWMTKSELYILLILWLILYCLLVLPQIDFWNLPSLLFNLED